MKKVLLFVFVCFSISNVNAQTLTPIHDSIHTSDNKYLHCDVYRPAGCTQCPTILIQTPYGKWRYQTYGLPLGFKFNINSSNYNIVITDWRGFYTNTSAYYAGCPNTGKDGYDVVQWIAAQSWSDGKIGTWGPSALGKVQYETARTYPPNLVCICPLVDAPQTVYNDFYPGGCLRTEYIEQLGSLGYGYSPTVEANPVHNNTWIYGLENPSWRPDSIGVPALMIGGWYDHNIEQMLTFFNAIRTLSPLSVRNQHKLLMGPWAHGGFSTAQVGTGQQGELYYTNAAGWSDSLSLEFFDYYLRNISNGYTANAFVQYYQMGENDWQTSAIWPPAGAVTTNFYFHDNLVMDNTSPTTSGNSLSYLYDPLNPSPTIGGPILLSTLKQGPWRQDTAVENRSDILVFSTPTLTQDVIMKGKAQVHLKISSDKKDTDFDVRLCDVDPAGRSMLLQTGVVRMRYRTGYNATDTASMVPGTIYAATIDLATGCNTFLTGHKIRVDISSSNYPQYNRNMNTGKAMYPGNKPDSLINPVVANNTVYMNSINFSYITLPVVPGPSSVKEISLKNDFTVFPNPANEEVTLHFQTETSGTILISDARGKIISKSNFSGTYKTIPTNNLDNGIYFVTVDNGTQTFTKKVAVVK
jgi:predicted acyl esterase